MTPFCLRNTVHDTYLAHKDGRLKKGGLGSRWFTTNDDGVYCDLHGTPVLHEEAGHWMKEVPVDGVHNGVGLRFIYPEGPEGSEGYVSMDKPGSLRFHHELFPDPTTSWEIFVKEVPEPFATLQREHEAMQRRVEELKQAGEVAQREIAALKEELARRAGARGPQSDAERKQLAENNTKEFHRCNKPILAARDYLNGLPSEGPFAPNPDVRKFLEGDYQLRVKECATNAYHSMTRWLLVLSIDIGHAQTVEGALYMLERLVLGGLSTFQACADHTMKTVALEVIVGKGTHSKGQAKVRPAVLKKIAEFNEGKATPLNFQDRDGMLVFQFVPQVASSLPRDMPEEEQPEGAGFGHFEFLEGAK